MAAAAKVEAKVEEEVAFNVSFYNNELLKGYDPDMVAKRMGRLGLDPAILRDRAARDAYKHSLLAKALPKRGIEDGALEAVALAAGGAGGGADVPPDSKALRVSLFHRASKSVVTATTSVCGSNILDVNHGIVLPVVPPRCASHETSFAQDLSIFRWFKTLTNDFYIG